MCTESADDLFSGNTNPASASLLAGEPGNLHLRKTAWWGWEDSNFQPNDYQPPELND
jgi:hypothetical protein